MSKEHPILFSAPMVKAILAGTKTQTRRVCTPQPSRELLDEYAQIRRERCVQKDDAGMLSECLPGPYGAPGDRLWVRETWRRDIFDHEKTLYRASHGDQTVFDKWLPSIHMPRKRSRITLEIVAVRVERLQDISTSDAIAEGMRTTLREHDAVCDLRDQYRALWEQIHGPDSWGANPWVWVIEFRRLPQTTREATAQEGTR